MPPYLAGRYKRSTAWDGSWVRGGVGGGHIQFHSIRVVVTVLAKLKTRWQKKDWVLVWIEFLKVEDHLVGAVGQERRDVCS